MLDGTTLPTQCAECDAPLHLISKDRTVCERCRLGRGGDYGTVIVPTRKAKAPAEAMACTACGREHLDDGSTNLPLADGYCLCCRLDGRHLGAATAG